MIEFFNLSGNCQIQQKKNSPKKTPVIQYCGLVNKKWKNNEIQPFKLCRGLESQQRKESIIEI